MGFIPWTQGIGLFIKNTIISYAISSVTNKLFGPKTQSSSPTYTLGTLQTQTNSSLVMPLPYGSVKCAGNEIWASPEGTVQHKIVSFGVGKIKGFRDVRLNDLVINTCPAFKISNTLYSDATIRKSGTTFYIKSNGVTTSFDLTKYTTILGLVTAIKTYKDATTTAEDTEWSFAETCFSSNTTSSINDIGETACHNNPVSLIINGLTGCSYTAYLGDGEQLIDDRVNGFMGTVDVYAYDANSPPATKIDEYGTVTDIVVGDTYVTDWELWTVYSDNGVLRGRRKTGTTQQLLNNTTQTERARLVGGLKYDAYLAITATASDKLSSSYNVTAIVDGRIVRVYTSLTEYTEQWSDNPAWCELDFKTSIDGCGMDMSGIDLQTYLNAANYYQPSGDQKRFTLNLILDEKKTRQDWLTEFFSTCRSYPTYQRGLHGILVDKPEEISQIFTVKPDESIETWWQDNDEDVERLQIEYVDPDYEYTKVLAQADRTQLPGETSQFRNKIPLTKKISIYGINNFKQASTEAWFHLNKAQTCPEWIQYTTNKRALNRSIGDVVGVWNPITEVVEDGLAYKRYRIMSMTEPQENNITMTMQEYNPNLYSFTMGSVAPTVTVTTLPNSGTSPPNVTNLTLDEDTYILKDGTALTDIIINFTPANSSNVSHYEVYCQNNGTGDFIYTGDVVESGCRVRIMQNNKTVIIKIVTVSKLFNLKSDGVLSASYVIVGKSDPPPDVTKFSVGNSNGKLFFTWSAVDAPDIRLYEIREGLSWPTSTLVQQVAEGTNYQTGLYTNGDKLYWIKALDRSRNYSTNATSYSIAIYDAPIGNAIINNVISINQSIGLWYMDDDDIYMDTPKLYMDRYIVNVGTRYIDVDSVDIGEIITANIIASYSATAEANTKISFEMRTSLDGLVYSNWQQYCPGSYTFRFVDLRLVIEIVSESDTVYIESMTISIDVPDRTVTSSGTLSIAAWTTVLFPTTPITSETTNTWGDEKTKTWGEVKLNTWGNVRGHSYTYNGSFHSIPSVDIWAKTYGAIAYTQNITKNGFDVILIDSKTQAVITGDFKYNAIGY